MYLYQIWLNYTICFMYRVFQNDTDDEFIYLQKKFWTKIAYFYFDQI